MRFEFKAGLLLLTGILSVLAFSLACGAESTATPAPKATSVPAATSAPVAPTSAPQFTATRIPGTPTLTAAVKPTYGGTIRYPLSISIDAPDPAYSNLTGTRGVMLAIFDNIVEFTPDGPISPGLTRSWAFSSDGKIITFNLTRNARFTDGTRVDATAVKWNFDRYLDKSVGSPRSAEIAPPLERVEVVDDFTVRLYLSTAFRPLLAQLTQQAGHIASPKAVQDTNSYANRTGAFGRNPIGSGPFRLKEWAPGLRFSFVRNEGYWQEGLPYVDAVEMPIIGDTQIQFAMLRTGEVDVMERMSPENLDIAKRNPKLRVVNVEGVSTEFMLFRVTTSPWNNKTLRQAFAYAVDRQAVADVVFFGRARPAQSAVGPMYGPWFDSTIQVYDYNPKKAKELLAQAGYPNGFSFDAPCRTGNPDGTTCEVLQASLKESGITMNIKSYENVDYFNDFTARKHNGPTTSYFSGRPDPSINLRRVFHSKSNAYRMDYINPEMDRLIEQAEGVYDVAAGKQIYRQMLMLLAEDAPAVYLAWWDIFFGLRDNVRNFTAVADGLPRFRDTWLQR